MTSLSSSFILVPLNKKLLTALLFLKKDNILDKYIDFFLIFLK